MLCASSSAAVSVVLLSRPLAAEVSKPVKLAWKNQKLLRVPCLPQPDISISIRQRNEATVSALYQCQLMSHTTELVSRTMELQCRRSGLLFP